MLRCKLTQFGKNYVKNHVNTVYKLIAMLLIFNYKTMLANYVNIVSENKLC